MKEGGVVIPDFQSIMLPLLRLSERGEIRISDAVDELADEFKLTPDELEDLLPSGKQTTFANRVHWAKSYLGKAGLIDFTRRAHFKINDRGRGVLQSPPARIDIKFLQQFSEFAAFRTQESDSVPRDEADMLSTRDDLTPDERIRQARDDLEAALGEELLARIHGASPAFFERLVVNLLVRMGYGGSAAKAGRALGKSGDGGIDGVIDEDLLGLDRIYIQAKRYEASNSVGPNYIRDFFGALDQFKAGKGIFFTTSYFTSSAIETASKLSKRIVLVDGQKLASLLIEHGVGCREEETVSIKRLDEEFFE